MDHRKYHSKCPKDWLIQAPPTKRTIDILSVKTTENGFFFSNFRKHCTDFSEPNQEIKSKAGLKWTKLRKKNCRTTMLGSRKISARRIKWKIQSKWRMFWKKIWRRFKIFEISWHIHSPWFSWSKWLIFVSVFPFYSSFEYE